MSDPSDNQAFYELLDTEQTKAAQDACSEWLRHKLRQPSVASYLSKLLEERVAEETECE